MLMFTEVSTFLSQRLLAYVPALPALFSGGMSFRSYVASSELTAELIGGASWFTNVMSEIAVLRANATRLTELAAAIERVRDRDRFYAETGRSDFRRREIIDGPMLAIARARALPSRARRAALRQRVAAGAAPGRPAARQRAERLRQELAPQGARGPLAVRRGPRGGGRGRPDVPRRAGGRPARAPDAAGARDLPALAPGTSTRWRSPRSCRAPALAASSASSTSSCTRDGRGATCCPAGRSSAWSSRGCCCRSRTSCCSTRPPRPSIRRVPRTSTTRWPSACPAAVVLSVLHSDALPTDSFGKPFYNRTARGRAPPGAGQRLRRGRLDRASRSRSRSRRSRHGSSSEDPQGRRKRAPAQRAGAGIDRGVTRAGRR